MKQTREKEGDARRKPTLLLINTKKSISHKWKLTDFECFQYFFYRPEENFIYGENFLFLKNKWWITFVISFFVHPTRKKMSFFPTPFLFDRKSCLTTARTFSIGSKCCLSFLSTHFDSTTCSFHSYSENSISDAHCTSVTVAAAQASVLPLELSF